MRVKRNIKILMPLCNISRQINGLRSMSSLAVIILQMFYRNTENFYPDDPITLSLFFFVQEIFFSIIMNFEFKNSLEVNDKFISNKYLKEIK